MLLLKLITPSRRRGTKSLHAIHPAEVFRELLNKERARADRTLETLSLLVVRSPRATSAGLPEPLIETIARRVRCCDEIGWLNSGNLGLLLPGTSPNGARALRDSLVALDTSGTLARCGWDVFAHPEPWPSTDFGDHNGHGDHDAHNGRGDRRGKGTDARRSENAPRDGATSDLEPAAAVGFSSVHSMSELFVVETPLWKRAIDVLGSSTLLLLASPFMLLAALLIRLTSPGPIFYTQTRAGLRGRPFKFYKFRTMVPDADKRQEELRKFNEQTGPVFKMENDPRVTPVGRVLRKLSIDELPQLWNVLIGDMSLVGPRPPIQSELAGYKSWHARRLEIAGGLTCDWQVGGRNKVQFDDWVRMDLRYIRGRSLFRDCMLLVKTVPAVMLRRGAS